MALGDGKWMDQSIGQSVDGWTHPSSTREKRAGQGRARQSPRTGFGGDGGALGVVAEEEGDEDAGDDDVAEPEHGVRELGAGLRGGELAGEEELDGRVEGSFRALDIDQGQFSNIDQRRERCDQRKSISKRFL